MKLTRIFAIRINLSRANFCERLFPRYKLSCA